MMAFQSLVEGDLICLKISPANERSPAGEMAHRSSSLVREGQHWNFPVVMRCA